MKAAAAGSAAIGYGQAPAAALAGALILALVAGAAIHAGVGASRVAVLLIVAPLIEEVLLRVGLHETLLRRAAPPWLAVVATSLAFGLAHAAIRGDAAALVVALPALLIGVVYQRTRRLRLCVALHATMNALWLAAGLAGTLPALAR
jgi:membrane protease YdiL (CAAX protease family)